MNTGKQRENIPVEGPRTSGAKHSERHDKGTNRSRDSQLRVLWLINGLGPGGAETLLVSAARVHDQQRFELVAAYLLPWKDAMVPALADAGVPAHCLGSRRRIDPRWVLRLRRLLAEGDFDIVHVHSPLVAGAARLLVATLPRGRRPAIVSTEHNRWDSFRPLTRVVNGLLFRLGSVHLAVSEAVRRSIWSSLRAEVEVLVHGVIVPDLLAAQPCRAAVRAELGVADDELLALTVANLRANKAYPDLLSAAAQVVGRGLPVRFAAVGQGPLEAEIRSALDLLDLGDTVRLLGRRDDVPKLLAAADLFVLASVYEGFPVAIMEAAVMGLPVVATNVGGLPEAITDGVEGRLVPPSRPDLLADAIVELASDADLRRRMSIAAARRGDDYDIERAVRRIEAIYERLGRRPGVGDGKRCGHRSGKRHGPDDAASDLAGS